MKIDKEVIAILAECEVEGNTLRITAQLERNVYAKVKKVLTAIGGKWNSKQRVHIFSADVEDVIQDIINTGEYTCIRNDYQFFPTPCELAEVIVKRADIRPGDTCLEPSAGTGNIARLMPGCDCVELNEENRKHLKENDFNVVHDDFMTYEPEKLYDVIVMNPPFKNGQDIDHITKAIKMARKTVVAVASASVAFRTNKKTQEFRNIIASMGGTIEPLPEDSFKESGTKVNTVLIVIKKAV